MLAETQNKEETDMGYHNNENQPEYTAKVGDVEATDISKDTDVLARDCFWHALDFTEECLDEVILDALCVHLEHCSDAYDEAVLDMDPDRFKELIALFETQALPIAQRAARKFVDDMWAVVNVHTDDQTPETST